MTKVNKQLRYTNRVPVDNLDDVRAILGKDPNDYVITLGKLAKGDGDAREYYWDVTSTANDNGDTVIKPTIIDGSSAGRWLKVINYSTPAVTVQGLKYELTVNAISILYVVPHTFHTIDTMVEVIDLDTVESVIVTVGRTLDSVTIGFDDLQEDGHKFKILILTF